MSLPPGFLDELRARTSISQVVGRRVTWDPRKSNQAKGDMWAPCPFHQEKTASFHVDDRKGFFYCFGCHEKGDAIGFLQKLDNLTFMEAVENLTREAGMTMPAQDPKAQEKASRLDVLAKVMEQAVRFFRLQLKSAAGANARGYLAQRGLSEAALDRWEIGFSPDYRTGLFDQLSTAGVAQDAIVDAGLCALPDGGGKPFDRFRGRIMYPIRDHRGRCIAFGGRALSADARAKYLNSPETELFDKSRTLFNVGAAREKAGKGQPLLVAEGYMDVIALAEGGFSASVAPLGTAITETQLEMLWRLSPAPVIMLDGDTAGLRAAMRLIDLALPLISPEKSLQFCVLPEGQDPDDLIRAEGAAGIEKHIAAAKPLVDMLWQRETSGKPLDSPEARASLDNALRDAVGKIRDQGLKSHYVSAIKERRNALFAAKRPQSGRSFRPRTDRSIALTSTRNSILANSNDADVRLRVSVILAVLVKHPQLIEAFLPALETMEIVRDGNGSVLAAMIALASTAEEPGFEDRLGENIEGDALEKLMALSHVRVNPAIRDASDEELARATVAEEIAKLKAKMGVEREIRDAIEDIETVPDEGITWRIGQATEARDRTVRGKSTGNENDGEDREMLSDFLQSLIDEEVWVKKNK